MTCFIFRFGGTHAIHWGICSRMTCWLRMLPVGGRWVFNFSTNDFAITLICIYIKHYWSQKDAFEIMSKLIVCCTNFKVRQAAASALTSVSSKTFYGNYYVRLWPCLLQAFDNSQNLTEFSEYKHQRNLIDQVRKIWVCVVWENSEINKMTFCCSCV